MNEVSTTQTRERRSGLTGIAALIAGVVFGAGLVVSGMTNPDIVLAFLTLNEFWNPALIFVMGSAVVVAMVGYALAGRRSEPLFADQFHAPASSQIDAPLLAGAAMFGVGWGLSGYCPGPAIVGALTLDVRALTFGGAFLLGMGLYALIADGAASQRGETTSDG